MMGGETALPTAAPVLKMPIPRARSFTGNPSPTTFAAPGQLPASPKPSTPSRTLRAACTAAGASALSFTSQSSPSPDAAPAAHRETLDRDHLWRIGRGNVRHDLAAGLARGAFLDLDGGLAFNGASTLENRWLADGFPIDSDVAQRRGKRARAR